jgi:hypothetical protein
MDLDVEEAQYFIDVTGHALFQVMELQWIR